MQQGGLGIGACGMPADRLVKRRAISRPCSGLGPPPRRGSEQSDELAQGSGASNWWPPAERNTAARRGAIEQVGCLHEVVGCLDPPWLRHSAGAQKHQPGAAGAGCGCFEPRPQAGSVELMNRHPAISATSAVASREPASAMTTSAKEAGGGSREPARPGSGTSARSEFVGGNDGAQHGTAAVRYRCHHIMWDSALAPRDRPPVAQIIGPRKGMGGRSATIPKGRCLITISGKIRKTGRPRSPIKQCTRMNFGFRSDHQEIVRAETVGNLKTVLVMFTYAG